jgi:hypothetical protein
MIPSSYTTRITTPTVSDALITQLEEEIKILKAKKELLLQI